VRWRRSSPTSAGSPPAASAPSSSPPREPLEPSRVRRPTWRAGWPSTCR
jgi:hypothetical protein